MTDFRLTYRFFGERSILIDWASNVSADILDDILKFKHAVEVSDISPESIWNAYHSLLISFKEPISSEFEFLVSRLKSLYKTSEDTDITIKNWRLPVSYENDYASDLEAFSRQKKLSVDEIIERHTAPVYTVYFIGFLPGFMYLGGLDPVLYLPRKSTPSLQVSEGSVAIGGQQTGIYPNKSPGGWHVIGNCPVPLFNPLAMPPCFVKSGDKVQFYPITAKKHQDILSLVEKDCFGIESI